MQTPVHPGLAAAGKTCAKPTHRMLRLDEPLCEAGAVCVSAWASDATQPAPWVNRSNLLIRMGPFSLSLNPSVADLRALSLLCTSTADEQEMRNHGLQPGQALDELAHAVGQMVRGEQAA